VPEGADLPPVSSWIVFDGKDANSYRAGVYRVTYTGGTGAHRADRMIIDYVNAAKVLGLDVSRIVVETADKGLSKRIISLGARVIKSTDGVEK
jgi:rRNA-processing protein FCF1